MSRKSEFRWLLHCAFGAALVLLACGLATARFGNQLQLPSTTTRDGTLTALNRYVRETVPRVVLVGSSLTFRLNEEYFSSAQVRNLALAGGSPITGLEIVASQPRLPRLILVEANILSRPPDSALIEKYAKGNNAEPMFFRPIRAAVAAYENWRHAPLTHADVSFALDRLVEQPPLNFDNHVYVDRAVAQWNADDPTDVLRLNLARLQRLIEAVDARGTKVLLFELPFAEPLETSRTARISRELAHAAFPDPAKWLRIEFDRSELRWPDGAHLDERSAVIVARSIDRVLPAMLPQ
jgi:hypothetical protein